MVRWLPPPPPADGELLLGHDAVALSFFVACVAATIALTSSMCSTCGPRDEPAADPDPAASNQQAGTGSNSGSGGDGQEAGAEEEEEEEEEEEVVVKLTPDLGVHGAIDAPTTAKRRLSVSMSKKVKSMKVPDKLRLSRRDLKVLHHKAESEDALWKKGIILGEKCKIPGEREAESGDPLHPADEVIAGSFRRSTSAFATFQQRQPQQLQDAPALHASDC